MERDVFHTLLVAFVPVFSQPGFQNFVLLLEGWIRAGGSAMPSTALVAVGDFPKHFATYYRFFSEGVWKEDALGRALVSLALPWAPEGPVTAVLDDTLARKTGKHIWGANLHHDPLAGACNALAFGHSWVVLALVVRVPLVSRPVALPVLWRLYRSRKDRTGKARGKGRERKTTGAASKAEFRTRPELAVELLARLRRILGPERRIDVLGDSAYGGKSVTCRLPVNTAAISRMPMDAALYARAPERQDGNLGRPRKKGRRLPSPRAMAAQPQGWKSATVRIYGKTVKARYKTAVLLWYNSTRCMPLRIVVVRDPKGQRKDDCFFSTDTALTPEAIIEHYARRWSLEVAFRDTKQLLGFERSQARTAKAVERTAPFAFIAYTVTVVWFAEHGHHHYPGLVPQRPWYRHKRAPSFADMLLILRTVLSQTDFSHTPANTGSSGNQTEANVHALRHAA